MPVRSKLAKIERLIGSDADLAKWKAHADLLAAFAAADPAYRLLVNLLAERLRTRVLARLLPRACELETLPATLPATPDAMTTDDLRAVFAVLFGGWLLDHFTKMPPGMFTTATFDKPPHACVIPTGEIAVCRRIVFTVVGADGDGEDGRESNGQSEAQAV